MGEGYARGKTSVIVRDHGVYLFPTATRMLRVRNVSTSIRVRFAAMDLWGDDASRRDSVHLDLWDDYLERV